jgi:hypothetical protein
MRKIWFITLLCGAALALPLGPQGQKPPGQQAQCRPNAPIERNWELIGHDYMYFGYTICPPAIANDAHPLVTIWLTFRGDGISVAKWCTDRTGADQVSVSHGDKKAYTLFRDLNAVSIGLLKAESRPSIPAEIAAQPFLTEGKTLVPTVNLTPEAAERIKQIFATADTLIQKGENEQSLLHVSDKLAALADLLNHPFKLA